MRPARLCRAMAAPTWFGRAPWHAAVISCCVLPVARARTRSLRLDEPRLPAAFATVVARGPRPRAGAAAFVLSMRQSDYAPLLRFLMLVIAGSAEGRCFVLRLPAKGKSNTGDVDRVSAWLSCFLPLFAPARMVPAQGCVSRRPLNRSPAMALTPAAA